MNKFKVGDRVAIYDGCITKHIGTVTKVGNNFLWACVTGKTISAHPKQCRRLVKKKKNKKFMYVRCKNSGLSTKNGRLEQMVSLFSGRFSNDYVLFVEAKCLE